MRRVAVIAACLTLCACAGKGTPAPQVEYTVYFFGGYVAYEYHLKDGTRCVTSVGSGTGVTCEWGTREEWVK